MFLDPNLIKVMHAASTLGLGGTEKVMQAFAANLDRDRFLPAVFAPRGGERQALLKEAGVPVFVGGDFFHHLMKFRPRVVHLHRAGWPDPSLLRPVRRYKHCMALEGTQVVVVETNVFGRHDPTKDSLAIDRHLFVSRFCRARYRAVHGLEVVDGRYGVLYNPVDTDAFRSLADARSRTPVVGRLSRPDPGKWSPMAMDFFPPLLDRVPEARYAIIGATDEARAFFRAQGVADRVDYVSPTADDAQLNQFLNACTVLAHANAAGESFGLAIAEAMAAGVPVVTHPSEGLRDNAQLELVEHDVTGLVARTTDEYVAAVAHLLTHPDAAARMGRAARERAVARFAQTAIVRELETVYAELLGVTPARAA